MCSELCDSFTELIDREDVSEQDCQDFLEENTEFLYPPFILNHGIHLSSIITKFPLDTSLVTDFVYLTKSSNFWHCVLVELEHPKRKLFIEKNNTIVPSQYLTAGIAQIHSWQDFLRINSEEVLRRLDPIRTPLRDNEVFFKYLLIIGRNEQKNGNKEMRDRFLTLGSSDFQIITYDSLINFYKNNHKERKNILRLAQKKYCFKYIHNMNSIFAYLGPDVIKLSNDQRKELILKGYDIESWEKGQLLCCNGQRVAPFQ